MAGLLTNGLDMAKLRLQVQGQEPSIKGAFRYRNFGSALMHIIRTEVRRTENLLNSDTSNWNSLDCQPCKRDQEHPELVVVGAFEIRFFGSGEGLLNRGEQDLEAFGLQYFSWHSQNRGKEDAKPFPVGVCTYRGSGHKIHRTCRHPRDFLVKSPVPDIMSYFAFKNYEDGGMTLKVRFDTISGMGASSRLRTHLQEILTLLLPVSF